MQRHELLHVATEVVSVLQMLLEVDIKGISRVDEISVLSCETLDNVLEVLLLDPFVVALEAALVEGRFEVGVALHVSFEVPSDRGHGLLRVVVLSRYC